MNPTPTNREDRPFPKNGAWFAVFLSALVGLVLLSGALASAGDGGWLARHRHGHARGLSHDPEAARAHAQTGAEWVLRYVDASEEQHEEMQRIVSETVDTLFPLGDQHRSNREAFVALLQQPEIDREALEELRQAELGLAEQASARLANALADAAEVLTPEQRAELVQMALSLHRFRH